MRTTEILQKVLPESWGIDAIHRVVETEREEGWKPDPLFRLEAIMPPHRARIDALAERLRLSRAEAARLHAWADAPEPDPAIRSARLRAGALPAADGRACATGFAMRLRASCDKDESRPRRRFAGSAAFAETWKPPVFPVSGKDLVAAGVEPGPAVGKRLRELEARWVESGFSLSRDALLRA